MPKSLKEFIWLAHLQDQWLREGSNSKAKKTSTFASPSTSTTAPLPNLSTYATTKIPLICLTPPVRGLYYYYMWNTSQLTSPRQVRLLKVRRGIIIKNSIARCLRLWWFLGREVAMSWSPGPLHDIQPYLGCDALSTLQFFDYSMILRVTWIVLQYRCSWVEATIMHPTKVSKFVNCIVEP